MNSEEKFIPEAKIENTVRENNNQDKSIETGPSSLEKVFLSKDIVANDEKKNSQKRAKSLKG